MKISSARYQLIISGIAATEMCPDTSNGLPRCPDSVVTAGPDKQEIPSSKDGGSRENK